MPQFINQLRLAISASNTDMNNVFINGSAYSPPRLWSMLTRLKLSARLGASADIPLRLATGTLRFAAITAMTKSAPLRVTAVAHGLLDQWHVAVVDAKGMTELNAEDSNKIRSSEFHRVTKVDTDNVDFDGISSLNFIAYKSGGALAFYEPMDLSGYTSARMDLKKVVDGDVELTANTANGLLTLDSATSTLWIHLTEADLANLKARDYVFDIELISPSAIDAICAADSVFTILPEVTTSTWASRCLSMSLYLLCQNLESSSFLQRITAGIRRLLGEAQLRGRTILRGEE